MEPSLGGWAGATPINRSSRLLYPPRRCLVVRNGTAAVPRAVNVPESNSLVALLTAAGNALGTSAHKLFDDDGHEIVDVTTVRPGQRLFVTTAPGETFLRERRRRCQLFQVAQYSTPEDDTSAAPPRRWHQGKVIGVPSTMSELRQCAADTLGLLGLSLAEDGTPSLRFRGADSGLLIRDTAAIGDDEILLVEHGAGAPLPRKELGVTQQQSTCQLEEGTPPEPPGKPWGLGAGMLTLDAAGRSTSSRRLAAVRESPEQSWRRPGWSGRDSGSLENSVNELTMPPEGVGAGPIAARSSHELFTLGLRESAKQLDASSQMVSLEPDQESHTVESTMFAKRMSASQHKAGSMNLRELASLSRAKSRSTIKEQIEREMQDAYNSTHMEESRHSCRNNREAAWQKHISPSGLPYWWNPDTQVSTWARPGRATDTDEKQHRLGQIGTKHKLRTSTAQVQTEVQRQKNLLPSRSSSLESNSSQTDCTDVSISPSEIDYTTAPSDSVIGSKRASATESDKWSESAASLSTHASSYDFSSDYSYESSLSATSQPYSSDSSSVLSE